MRRADSLGDVFEDLEQQAEGLHLAERDAELVDRSRSEYAQVTFAARLHASVGRAVTLTVTGVGRLDGTLARAGVDWCLVETPATPTAQEWVVAVPAVSRAGGLSERAVNESARSVVARLTMRSALRGIADSRAEVLLHHLDGSQVRGRLARVGADFVEVVTASDAGADSGGGARHRGRGAEVLALSLLAAVRRT